MDIARFRCWRCRAVHFTQTHGPPRWISQGFGAGGPRGGCRAVHLTQTHGPPRWISQGFGAGGPPGWLSRSSLNTNPRSTQGGYRKVSELAVHRGGYRAVPTVLFDLNPRSTKWISRGFGSGGPPEWISRSSLLHKLAVHQGGYRKFSNLAVHRSGYRTVLFLEYTRSTKWISRYSLGAAGHASS